MKARHLILALSSCLVAACTLERYEGGFETSDLHARVTTPLGNPAVAARIWLVRAQGDTAPGIAIDSSWTDSAGLVKFTVARTTDRANLSLDAKLGEWKAILPFPFRRSDSARLPLSTTYSVTTGADSTGTAPRLFVPGSHFLSTVASNGRTVLTLPTGSWTIAKTTSTGTVLVPPVQVDTLPIALDSLEQKPNDTTKSTDSTQFVRSGDSLRIDGISYFADNAFPLPSTWTRGTGTLDSCRLLSGLVSDDTGTIVLETRPAWITIGSDTQNVQGGSQIVSGTLPDTGTLAIQFLDAQSFLADTILIRTLSLTDSVGAGSMVRLVSPLDSVLTSQGQQTTPQSNIPVSAPALVQAATWYFSWTPSRITVRADTTLIGTVSSQTPFRRLRFSVAASSFRRGTSAIRLPPIRLYVPR
ncbi:MAG: hypothetical protein RL173_2200 [Fibrobacterota bacterium]|jgi:hypothetical protein